MKEEININCEKYPRFAIGDTVCVNQLIDNEQITQINIELQNTRLVKKFFIYRIYNPLELDKKNTEFMYSLSLLHPNIYPNTQEEGDVFCTYLCSYRKLCGNGCMIAKIQESFIISTKNILVEKIKNNV